MVKRVILIAIGTWFWFPCVLAERGWTDPHPMRLDAFVGGRDFTYNSLSFLDRFSYHSLSDAPAPGEDGLCCTGGSTRGDELYLDIDLQKTLSSDTGPYGAIGRMQRREDFDGRFDRQLVGISRDIGEAWDAAFVADITGDKAKVDFQYEANWRPRAGQYLRLAVVQTDRLYNDKSDSDDEYGRTPVTAFAHYRQPVLSSGHMEIAVNYSPRASYDDRSRGVSIDGDQLRLMAATSLPVSENWHTRLRLEVERSDREFEALPGESTSSLPDFERRMHRVTWSMEAPDRRWSPHWGLRYFELDESGWFGENLAVSGNTRRREAYLFFGGVVARSDKSHWEPTVYLARINFERQFSERPGKDRDRNKWAAKLTLPWRYVLHEESGAMLTINPTVYLHTFAFGGGNIQLHWPF